MNLIGADRPPERDELPDTLFPERAQLLYERENGELDKLVERNLKLATLDESKYPPGVARRMRHLSQYAGRSKEGMRRSLGNLRRMVKTDMADTESKDIMIPEGTPPVKVPTAIPSVPLASTVRGRFLRLTLSKEEFDLYKETWVAWFTQHKDDYDMIEDVEDVHSICMETVDQFRIRRLQMAHPHKDYTASLQSSFIRMKTARDNLDACRRARLERKGKSGGNTIINVAIAAGETSIAVKKQQQMVQSKKVDDFLEATVVQSQTRLLEQQKTDEEEK